MITQLESQNYQYTLQWDDHKNLLDKMFVDGQYLKDYSSHYDDINVGFTLTFQPGMLTGSIEYSSQG